MIDCVPWEAKELSQETFRSALACCAATSRASRMVTSVPTVETLEKMGRALEVPLYRFFYDGAAPPKLENLPKRKTADDITWGRSGKDARHLSNFRRFLGRVEERDRKLLMLLAQKSASKRNGRRSIAG